MSSTWRLAAIAVADVVGYGRLLKADEAETPRKSRLANVRRWPTATYSSMNLTAQS